MAHEHHPGCAQGTCLPECRYGTSTLSGVPLDADATRELSRAAKQVTSWTERRNALIKAAHEAGGGVREIARATGLNVGTVHNILHGRKR